jgi:hypothetical protein
VKINESDIAVRKTVGETKSGAPIVYVQTHGGLHAIFKRGTDGNVHTIAAAPHVGIVKFLAEKAEDGLKWHDSFNKSEDLAKSESDRFERLRALMFAPVPPQALDNPSNLYLAYDINERRIDVIAKSEFSKLPSSFNHTLVRSLSLAEPACLLSDLILRSK